MLSRFTTTSRLVTTTTVYTPPLFCFALSFSAAGAIQCALPAHQRDFLTSWLPMLARPSSGTVCSLLLLLSVSVLLLLLLLLLFLLLLLLHYYILYLLFISFNHLRLFIFPSLGLVSLTYFAVCRAIALHIS